MNNQPKKRNGLQESESKKVVTNLNKLSKKITGLAGAIELQQLNSENKKLKTEREKLKATLSEANSAISKITGVNNAKKVPAGKLSLNMAIRKQQLKNLKK